MASRRNHLLFLLVLLSLEAITGDEHNHKVRQYCLRLSLDLFLYVPPQLIVSSLLCSFKVSLSYFVKLKIIVDGKFSFCWCDRSYLPLWEYAIAYERIKFMRNWHISVWDRVQIYVAFIAVTLETSHSSTTMWRKNLVAMFNIHFTKSDL